mmetsp:Transcript_31136/g.54732  ORF Transcript_31136/g.54732 Transcript_31136/m.54732 type:complete len:291 (+) Transcript_31136:2-874(+)
MSRCIHTVSGVAEMRKKRAEMVGKKVGFVPTMGALHQGHISLCEAAARDCDEIVASIFVNPTQFAAHEDLGTYPRDLEGDLDKLSQIPKVTTVFYPDAKEMYPDGLDLVYVGVDHFEETLREGKSRPGHFRGVATIVTKLLNVVQPHIAYFGQKDAGQCIVIQNLVKELMINTHIEKVPTLREPDGLAMSSRNMYLTESERPDAIYLYNALVACKKLYDNGNRQGSDILQEGLDILGKCNKIEILYLDLCYSDSGASIKMGDEIEGGKRVIVSGAIMLGKTRLIDNLILG